MATPPGMSDEGRVDRRGRQPHIAGGYYQGGAVPPTPQQMTPAMQAELYRSGGTSDHLSPGQVKTLQQAKWSYGQPAPHGFIYNSDGILVHKESVGHQIASVALQAAPIIATVATGGAAAPWLMASIAGGTGVAGARLAGASWKQSFIAGGLAAASTGLASAPVSQTTQLAGQTGIGMAGGAMNGGGAQGALLGGLQAGASTGLQQRNAPRRT